MGDLTHNLSRHEFKCQCGSQGKEAKDGYCEGKNVAADFKLVDVLQGCCDYFAGIYGPVRIQITSGNRCINHNRDVGGVDDSTHVYGIAADFKIFVRANGKQVSRVLIAKYLRGQYPDKFGIGVYSNRNHLDVRSTSADWTVE